MYLTVPPVDMLAFLIICQSLPVVLLGREAIDMDVARLVLVGQVTLTILFFVFWGGYARDSWDYLMAFGDPQNNPFDRNREWLFWWLGRGLSKVLIDPWPLKVMCAVGATLICVSIVAFFGRKNLVYAVAGLFVLWLVPSFLLLMGSAVRQGLAGAVVVLGLVFLYAGRERSFWACAVLAVLCHVSAIVFVLAGLCGKHLRRWVVYVLCLAPIVSFLIWQISPLIGMEEHIPYADRSEGQFHWSKAIVAYALATIALFVAREASGKEKSVLIAYVYMVAFSAFFVVYEVPFERFLSYSELLIPIVGAICLKVWSVGHRQLRLLWFGGLMSGPLLWSHHSIVYTLGFAGGYEYCC